MIPAISQQWQERMLKIIRFSGLLLETRVPIIHIFIKIINIIAIHVHYVNRMYWLVPHNPGKAWHVEQAKYGTQPRTDPGNQDDGRTKQAPDRH